MLIFGFNMKLFPEVKWSFCCTLWNVCIWIFNSHWEAGFHLNRTLLSCFACCDFLSFPLPYTFKRRGIDLTYFLAFIFPLLRIAFLYFFPLILLMPHLSVTFPFFFPPFSLHFLRIGVVCLRLSTTFHSYVWAHILRAGISGMHHLNALGQ